MKESRFRDIYNELIDENPFAVRAVLRILQVEFSDEVPTLAVTCVERPRLLVNLEFLEAHCKQDSHVKAVICHEFLHVLLRHTERFRINDPARHLAFDAVINAIIHREMGSEYSGMMSDYYREATGLGRLLRPITMEDRGHWGEMRDADPRAAEREYPHFHAWHGLYMGSINADDIAEIASDFRRKHPELKLRLIGGHEAGQSFPDGDHEALPEALREALGRSLSSMNGSGIWRIPKSRGLGAPAFRNAMPAADTAVERWKHETQAVLERHLQPDPQGKLREVLPHEFCLPVLSPGDRRAALRSLWSPFLPEARWHTQKHERSGSAQVYLDVSGSMYAEMPLLIALLQRLHRHIRKPLWAFSTEVARAHIEKGQLIADTTGGTSMSCVLDHVALTQPPSAVVITDGYIERLQPEILRSVAGTRLHVIVTRDGNSHLLEAAGIPVMQLGRLPG